MDCVEKISVDDFKKLFCDFLMFCIDNIELESEMKEKLKKIQSKSSKIAYEKIIEKIIANIKLQELLMEIALNEFETKYINTIMEDPQHFKELNIIPDLNIGEILINLDHSNRQMCYSLTLNLCKCGILISMNPNNDKDMEETFNALKNSTLKSNGEFTIDSFVNTTQVETQSVPEMILKFLSNKNVDLNETFQNMDEKGVNDASDKLKDTLNSDKFKDSAETANFLATALDGVKDKLLNVTNKDMTNVECFDQIQNIGQEMSEKMMENMGNKNIDPNALLDNTKKLAQEIMPDANIAPYFNMINKMLSSHMHGGADGQQNVTDLKNLDLNQIVKLTKSQKKGMTKKQIREAKKQQQQLKSSMLPKPPTSNSEISNSYY